MYNFIDVNHASESAILPSEALKINGKYIENQIRGYRTLHVSGREALSPELATYTTGVRDGSVMKNKRFPARTITVTYQIIADSSAEFRKAYNKLAAILNVENAELIFNDEQDKYFVGTPSAIGTPEPGKNAVIGEFEILCVDPFKYSVVEYVAEPATSDGSFLVNYGGTYKSYPTFEAEFYKETEISEDGENATELTNAGDCGYIAFKNERKKIIQLGNPAEQDTETFNEKKNQKLISSKFDTQSSWGSAAKSLWSVSGDNNTLRMDYAYPLTPKWEKKNTYTHLLTVKSKTSLLNPELYNPGFTYEVEAHVYDRTADSAGIEIQVTTSMFAGSNFFGYNLIAWIDLDNNGLGYEIVLRRDKDPTWYGTEKHTATVRIRQTGLTSKEHTFNEIKFLVHRGGSSGQAGVIAETTCAEFTIPAYELVREKHDSFLTVPDNRANYSKSEILTNIARSIPADWTGNVGATSFNFYVDFYFDLGANPDYNQKGQFSVKLLSKDQTNTNGIVLNFKKDGYGKTATASVLGIWGGVLINKEGYEFNVANNAGPMRLLISVGNASVYSTTGSTGKYSYVNIRSKAFGSDIGFFTRYRAILDEIQLEIGVYKNSPLMARNGIVGVEFIKTNCETERDIPNTFGSNDVLNVDCSNGEILLNGISKPGLGALGNDWEEFCLEPGLNQMGYAYSEWTPIEYGPKVKMRYREVFL